MQFNHILILIVIGVVHSALLWIVTLGAKRMGAPGPVLQWMPLVLGVISAFFLFPLALFLVTGVEIHSWEQLVVGAFLGFPAALGAESAYRISWAVMPKLIERILGEE